MNRSIAPIVERVGAVSDDPLFAEAHKAISDLVHALTGYACSCEDGYCEDNDEQDRDSVGCGFNARQAINNACLPKRSAT